MPIVTIEKPLQGKRVIVTRPREQAGEFARLLEARGAELLYFPTIEIVPPTSWDEADEAIAQDRSYDALIFTSSNAVRFYFERARARGLGADALLRKTVYVLGSKTAEAASLYGAQAVRFAGVRNARDFGAALAAHGAHHRRWLLPKGRLAGSDVTEALKAHGETVDEVVVYDTVMPAEFAAAGGARDALAAGTADVLTFFSPSSAENFFALMGDRPCGDAAIAAIGETTAAALRALGMRVDIVPAHPDAGAFAEAIAQYFTGTPHHITTRNEDL